MGKRGEPILHLQKTEDLLGMAAPYNPRQISDEELAKLGRSLRYFGTVQPIIVNTRSGHIVGGHQRVKAAKLEGIDELPVIEVDLDDPSEKQLNLALNKISGQWDEDALSALLRQLNEDGADLELTGFDDSEIQKLIKEITEEADPEPEPEEKPTITQPGDLWELGPHRLLCGDSTNEGIVADLLGNAEPKLQVVDPPFDMAYSAWDVLSSVDLLYVWGRGYQVLQWLGGFDWDKWGVHTLCLTGNARGWAIPATPCIVHETVYVLRRGDAFLDTAVLEQCGARTTVDGRHFSFHEKALGRSNAMSWAKSVYSMELAMAYVPRGSAVWDPCTGSGTSLRAAERHGRVFYGCEMQPRWCDLAVRLWEQESGHQATRHPAVEAV